MPQVEIAESINSVLNGKGYQILIQINDEVYSGDSRMLLYKQGKYGILIIGLDFESEETYLQWLEESILWFDSEEECVSYMHQHCWDSSKETQHFVRRVIKLLTIPYCYMI